MAVGAVLGSFDSRASAQVQEVEMPPSEVAARGHYLMGLEHYSSGRFHEAASEFRQAYELSSRPALLYNIFLAHRDAGDTANAVAALRAYLDAEPEAPNAELLRARLSTLEVQLEAERAREDERAASRLPAEQGAEQTVRDDVPAPPAALDIARDTDGESSVAPWIVVGSGAALLVGAAVTGGLAVATYDALDASCPDRRCPAEHAAESR